MSDEDIGYKAGFKYGQFAEDSGPPFGGRKTVGAALDHCVERGFDGVNSVQAMQGFIPGYFDGRESTQASAKD